MWPALDTNDQTSQFLDNFDIEPVTYALVVYYIKFAQYQYA